MKERPILFSGEMVRAILDGRKTQTRRIVKQQLTALSDSSDMFCFDHKGISYRTSSRISTVGAFEQIKQFCPYGQPGDRLWVRETWHADGDFKNVAYRATDTKLHDDMLWKPSIFMPRHLSRITLTIKTVRVERLQDISEADALDEGITYNHLPNNGLDPMKARHWYRRLWETINGPGSWDATPWVWVIEFKQVN